MLRTIIRSPSVEGRPRTCALKSPRVTTSNAPAKPPARPTTFQKLKRSRNTIAASTADQIGVTPMSHPVLVAEVIVSANACSIWCTNTPMNPISASAGQASRGGNCRTSSSNNTAAIANREKISDTGEISRNAAFVATNDTPQKMTAMNAARRGGSIGGT